ncbi:hypothetical protein NDU88_006161 [Pleurodeles waltl]|uniref:Uncharacterized protein n=1 Tax=Pleurodeles waltl TaxID=8319 RepID=A0AAV7TWV0_PLEWA|nr:hypothetical protein NDU88_006161 [Pleurodeles waltl]
MPHGRIQRRPRGPGLAAVRRAAPRLAPRQARHRRSSSGPDNGPRPLPPQWHVPQGGDHPVLRLPRTPEGPSRKALKAQGRSRPEAPRSRLTSRGRWLRQCRPPAPPRRSMGPWHR